jgi:hypothetical protein
VAWLRGRDELEGLKIDTNYDWVWDVVPGEKASFDVLFWKDYVEYSDNCEIVIERLFLSLKTGPFDDRKEAHVALFV